MRDINVELVDDYSGSYCGDCGHFHLIDVTCPDRDSDCGSFLCCNGMSDSPTVVNIYGANYGTINM